MIRGVTLDAGFLIAYQRNRARAKGLLADAAARGADVTVPAVVIAEVWRGGHATWLRRLLEVSVIEEVDADLARQAGELLARTGRADAVDALVAASAARRGDVVATSDPGDLQRFADDLGTIRVWQV